MVCNFTSSVSAEVADAALTSKSISMRTKKNQAELDKKIRNFCLTSLTSIGTCAHVDLLHHPLTSPDSHFGCVVPVVCCGVVSLLHVSQSVRPGRE